MLVEVLGVPGRVGPRVIVGLRRVLVDRIGERRLGILREGRIVARESGLTEVESDAALEAQLRQDVEAAVHVSEDSIVLVDVVLRVEGFLERVALVAETRGLAPGKVPGDVVDRNDGLHQDVLAENTVFGISARIIRQASVTAIEREGHFPAEIELAPRDSRMAPTPPSTD